MSAPFVHVHHCAIRLSHRHNDAEMVKDARATMGALLKSYEKDIQKALSGSPAGSCSVARCLCRCVLHTCASSVCCTSVRALGAVRLC